MSNIISVLNPPPNRNLKQEETTDCLACQVLSSLFSLAFGGYLASGQPFKYSNKEYNQGITLAEFESRNPMWWKCILRGFGSGLILYGIVRGTEGWIWNKSKKYKKF